MNYSNHFNLLYLRLEGQETLEYPTVYVNPRAQKFNIVNNDHGRTENSVFDWKYPFWENLAQKNQIWQFKLKFGNYAKSNKQNSMVMFPFSVFGQKYTFWVNLVQETAQKMKFSNKISEEIPNGKLHF